MLHRPKALALASLAAVLVVGCDAPPEVVDVPTDASFPDRSWSLPFGTVAI